MTTTTAYELPDGTTGTAEEAAAKWREEAWGVLADHKRDIERAARLRDELDRVTAESAGRLAALNEKADEARREWARAEKAEAERDTLRADLATMTAIADGHAATLRAQGETMARLTAERDEARAVAYQLALGKYLEWGTAGGVGDCRHGVGRRVPCRDCDVDTALAWGPK